MTGPRRVGSGRGEHGRRGTRACGGTTARVGREAGSDSEWRGEGV